MLPNELFLKVLESRKDIYIPTEDKRNQESLRVSLCKAKAKMLKSIQASIGVAKATIQDQYFIKLFYRDLDNIFIMQEGALVLSQDFQADQKELERIARLMRVEGRSEKEIEEYIKEFNESKEIAKLGGDEE